MGYRTGESLAVGRVTYFDCTTLYEYVIISVMSLSRSRTSRVFTISFPEDLATQVEEVARQESRNISELFREAFRTYRLERMQRKLGTIHALPLPLAPDHAIPKTTWKSWLTRFARTCRQGENARRDRRSRLWYLDLSVPVRRRPSGGYRRCVQRTYRRDLRSDPSPKFARRWYGSSHGRMKKCSPFSPNTPAMENMWK